MKRSIKHSLFSWSPNRLYYCCHVPEVCMYTYAWGECWTSFLFPKYGVSECFEMQWSFLILTDFVKCVILCLLFKPCRCACSWEWSKTMVYSTKPTKIQQIKMYFGGNPFLTIQWTFTIRVSLFILFITIYALVRFMTEQVTQDSSVLVLFKTQS